MQRRAPWVAGKFYSADPDRLAREVEQKLTPRAAEPKAALCVVAPHAGYVYSGGVAGRTYADVIIPDFAVVLCPNHTGLGARRSVWSHGHWQLPGREVPVDAELAELLLESGACEADTAAHLREHAIEVQLPFLSAKNSQVAVLPVCLARHSFAECRELGLALAAALEKLRARGPTLIVASTDMSHYVAADVARELDGLAIQRMLDLDARGLHETVEQHRISMCGFVPTTVAFVAAKALGARAAELVEYTNSGAVSGDFDQVVGYAGVIVS